MNVEFTWFFRFSIRDKGQTVELSTLVVAADAHKAWNKLVADQMSRHEISRTDIDILMMNKV